MELFPRFKNDFGAFVRGGGFECRLNLAHGKHMADEEIEQVGMLNDVH